VGTSQARVRVLQADAMAVLGACPIQNLSFQVQECIDRTGQS
jgi:hypothetical protein